MAKKNQTRHSRWIRKIMVLFLLLFTVTSVLTPQTVMAAQSATLKIDGNTAGMNKQEAAAYRKMKALKKKFPEGKRWTNANYYAWKGGIFTGGYGCAGFAFRLSDAAFGSKPARMHYNFNKIRVGDVVRVNYDTHFVIIMKVVGTKYVVAEGNYNSSIHWGRVMTRSEIRRTGSYVLTRW